MKKIRIRHRGDRAMYFGETGWTLNSENAKVFETPLEAMTFIIRRQIGNAELIADTIDPLHREIALAV
ncbi:MAG TPA: hypothetical protein VGF13_17660 [Verrucomicrobiae bacterium]|jgi:hypothetical protein